MAGSEHSAQFLRDKSTIQSISQYLRSLNESYYYIFMLLLETGESGKTICNLKVKDIRNKKQLPLNPSRKKLITRQIPDSLAFEIDKHLEKKKPNDYAFPNSENKPILPHNFSKTLRKVSGRLHIYPYITMQTLKHTFLLNKYLISPSEAAKYTHHYSKQKLITMWGDNIPVKSSAKQSEIDTYTLDSDIALLSSNIDKMHDILLSFPMSDIISHSDKTIFQTLLDLSNTMLMCLESFHSPK